MIHLQSPLLSRAAPAVPVYLFPYLWSLAVWLRWAASCDADPHPAPTPAPDELDLWQIGGGICVPLSSSPFPYLLRKIVVTPAHALPAPLPSSDSPARVFR